MAEGVGVLRGWRTLIEKHLKTLDLTALSADER